MSKLNRRTFLKNSLASTALAMSSSPSFSKTNDNLIIHGLTTFDPSKPQHTPTSVMLSLNLTTGHVQHTELDSYQFGHCLIALPEKQYFAVPYGDDTSPCLFLDQSFNIIGEILAPNGYGFGGHSQLMPNKKTIFVHFNKQGGTVSDTGQYALIDITSKKIVKNASTQILHAHDIILSANQEHIIVADDGNVGESDTGPYVINSHQPALHFFDATSSAWLRSIPLDINGSLVHIETNTKGSIFGATEQYLHRNQAGFDVLQKLLGAQAKPYLDSFDPEVFSDEIPLPGPLLSVNAQTDEITRYRDIRNQDPFDIKLNKFTGNMINVFTSHNRIAALNKGQDHWQYKSTSEFNVEEPFGLVDISGTPYMAINGFNHGIAIFDTETLDLHRYYDIPCHGLKHMILSE